MERCVDSVLSRLARAKVAEAQVGPATLSECEGALQVALADAIESGEAPAVCKVGVVSQHGPQPCGTGGDRSIPSACAVLSA